MSHVYEIKRIIFHTEEHPLEPRFGILLRALGRDNGGLIVSPQEEHRTEDRWSDRVQGVTDETWQWISFHAFVGHFSGAEAEIVELGRIINNYTRDCTREHGVQDPFIWQIEVESEIRRWLQIKGIEPPNVITEFTKTIELFYHPAPPGQFGLFTRQEDDEDQSRLSFKVNWADLKTECHVPEPDGEGWTDKQLVGSIDGKLLADAFDHILTLEIMNIDEAGLEVSELMNGLVEENFLTPPSEDVQP